MSTARLNAASEFIQNDNFSKKCIESKLFKSKKLAKKYFPDNLVVIRFWEHGLQGSGIETGHVSLQTKKYYISFFPKGNSWIKRMDTLVRKQESELMSLYEDLNQNSRNRGMQKNPNNICLIFFTVREMRKIKRACLKIIKSFEKNKAEPYYLYNSNCAKICYKIFTTGITETEKHLILSQNSGRKILEKFKFSSNNFVRNDVFLDNLSHRLIFSLGIIDIYYTLRNQNTAHALYPRLIKLILGLRLSSWIYQLIKKVLIPKPESLPLMPIDILRLATLLAGKVQNNFSSNNAYINILHLIEQINFTTPTINITCESEQKLSPIENNNNHLIKRIPLSSNLLITNASAFFFRTPKINTSEYKKSTAEIENNINSSFLVSKEIHQDGINRISSFFKTEQATQRDLQPNSQLTSIYPAFP